MTIEIKLDVETILGRIKEAMSCKTDIELARLLNVHRATLASWKSRNSIPMEIIVSASAKIDTSVDYLLFGKTRPPIDPEKQFKEELEYEFKSDGFPKELRKVIWDFAYCYGHHAGLEEVRDYYESVVEVAFAAWNSAKRDSQL